MWFRKRNEEWNGNRRRGGPRDPLLMVNARGSDRGRDRAHKIGAIVVLLVAGAGSVWAAVSGAGLLGEWLFARNDHFTVRRVDVRSNGRLQPSHIREYGHVAEGMNLFGVSIDQVRRDLESVPLIRSAEVQRDLPDTLVVRVTERTALARIAEGAAGFPVAVDQDGYVLGPSLGRTDLVLISGLSEKGLAPGSVVRERAVLDALNVLEVCDTTKLGSVVRIASIDVRNPEYLDIRLASGARVQMGRDQLSFRLERLADIVRTSTELGQEVVTADLTVDRNFPVEYRKAEARAR